MISLVMQVTPVIATSEPGAERQIRGSVTDAATDHVLARARIHVQSHPERTTASDSGGRFSIRARTGDVLVVSRPGYSAREGTVTRADQLRVELHVPDKLETVTIVGSRGKPRVLLDRPVAVDVLTSHELQTTSQADLGQMLHFSTPSFNAVRFGINDLGPLVDPATLRGLGPDQTLVLINNKRRHKVSFFNLNDGLGKGQVGTDMGVVPSAALQGVEILRDGAAVQYGSDAIAGVINMRLKDSASGGSIRVYTGIGVSQPTHLNGTDRDGEWVMDGATLKTELNFGTSFAEDGFLNTTLHLHHSRPYDRSGTYAHPDGWYTADPALDARLRALNNISLDRTVLGSRQNSTLGVFINAGKPLSDDWDLYAFGGYAGKKVVGNIFSRAPTRADRAVLEIFPDGYNPVVPATLRDATVVAGAKGELALDWTLDVSAGYGLNHVDLFARNTVNPSLGAQSPTEFFTGATEVTQTAYSNIAAANDGRSVIRPFIPVRSPLASTLGISGLRPEISLGYSLGLTSQWADGALMLAADAYQIDIADRIVVSGSIDVSRIPDFVDLGYTDEANIFNNAIDTRTRGLDFVASLTLRLNPDHKLTLAAALNLNHTSITDARSPDSLGQDIVDWRAAVYLTHATPRDKVILTANHSYKDLLVTLRATRLGAVEDPRAGDPNTGDTIFRPRVVTDLSATFPFSPPTVLDPVRQQHL